MPISSVLRQGFITNANKLKVHKNMKTFYLKYKKNIKFVTQVRFEYNNELHDEYLESISDFCSGLIHYPLL